jgi:hypothetical protein
VARDCRFTTPQTSAVNRVGAKEILRCFPYYVTQTSRRPPVNEHHHGRLRNAWP